MPNETEKPKTSLFGELKRRNVFRVAAVYIITSWLILQIADVVLPALKLPDWTISLVVVLLALGFPVAMVFAWIFELTHEGVVRDQAPSAQFLAGISGRTLDFAIIGILAVAVIVLLLRQEYFMQPDTSASPGPRAAHKPAVESAGKSIAVLPFRNMSEDISNEYFSDGIAEEILNALVRVPKLKVVGWTSALAFKDEKRDLREIGRALGASHILEGSVRRWGTRLRITAQLIETQEGYHLWSETYDAEFDDIFAVQEKLSRAIVEALRLQLMPDELARLGRLATNDVFAYDIYLRAQGVLRNAVEPGDYDSAIALFDDALHKDPSFAEAEAGKCSAYNLKYDDTRDTSFIDDAIRTCDRAYVMDEDSPEVLVALGDLYNATGRSDFAIERLENSLGRWRGHAEIQRSLADAYAAAGRHDEAHSAYLKSIAIAPEVARTHARLAGFLYRRGRFEDSIAEWLEAIALEPKDHRHYSNMGGVYFYMGHFADAADAYSRSIEFFPNGRAYSNAGTNYYYAGDFERALSMFTRAVELLPEDFRPRGNLGDACRMVPLCAPEAADHYRQAIELADAQLRINPENAAAAALRSVYLAHLYQPREAIASLNRALSAENPSLDVLWSAAVTFTLLGEDARAREYVERAQAEGYPAASLVADPDLQPLYGAAPGNPSK